VLYTNFYFLNGPTSSPVTALFTQWFGEQWYLLGFLPAVALVLAGMYLPWYIHRKK
jgi:integral membrane protein